MLDTFLQFQTALRLYHWNTRSYARHMASGKLYEKLDTLIDAFIETYQGRLPSGRISYAPFTLKGKVISDKQAETLLRRFSRFLEGLTKHLSPQDSDLLNVRDEMLNEVDRTLYLFSLAK